MRILPSILALSLALASTTPALAANVLTPSDTSATTLGLMPSTGTTTPAQQTQTSTSTGASSSTTTTPLFDKNQATKEAILNQYKNTNVEVPENIKKFRAQRDAGTITPTFSPEVQKIRDQVTAAREAMMPKTPPRIIDAPQLPEFPDDGSGKNKISFRLTPDSTFSTSDLDTIKTMLGYSSAEAQQKCMLRLDANITVTDSPFPNRSSLPAGVKLPQMSSSAGKFFLFRITPNLPHSISFNESISRMILMPKAVCAVPAGELPQHGGVLMRDGNAYSVQLMSSVSCEAPSGTGVLEIKYGNQSGCTLIRNN